VAQAHTWQVSVRLSVTYNHNAGAKKRRLARPEPTWPVKLLKTKDQLVSERVGFEPCQPCRICNLQILHCQGCRKCQGCRGPLLVFAHWNRRSLPHGSSSPHRMGPSTLREQRLEFTLPENFLRTCRGARHTSGRSWRTETVSVVAGSHTRTSSSVQGPTLSTQPSLLRR
jgi:hypothetical protein